MQTNIFNIIILDASGSMQSIKKQAIDGYNETVQTIKASQKKYAETQKHFITLVTFNSTETKTPFYNVPCENATELNDKLYQPDSGTPLYDAMGFTLTKARKDIELETNYAVLVTIITDGEENASVEYTSVSVKKLVEELQTKNWTFQYMGANQDIYEIQRKLSIRDSLAFDSSPEGTKEMFKMSQQKRAAYYKSVETQCTASEQGREKDVETERTPSETSEKKGFFSKIFNSKNLLFLFAFLAVVAVGCKPKTPEQLAKEEQEKIFKQLDFRQCENIVDSSNVVLDKFLEILDEEKEEEALAFYLHNEYYFVVVPENSTDRFDFNYTIAQLLYKYKDEAFAYEKIIKIFELNLVITESVILFSNGETIPTHYYHLINLLYEIYIDTGNYEDALKMADKIIDYYKKQPDEKEYALLLADMYYHKALVYFGTDNFEKANEYNSNAISTIKKYKLNKNNDDDGLYEDCVSLKKEIEEKDKKKK